MKRFLLSAFQLKVIACLLMTLDHVAMLFLPGGIDGQFGTLYYVLRAVGKISFPIFAFLAVDGVYHTHNIYKYIFRLLVFSLVLDSFGFLVGGITGITIRSNPLIGNAFTDILLGVSAVYFLKKKSVVSFFAIVPIAVSVLTCIDLGNDWGTIFKADWGFFSMVLFLLLFLAREGTAFYLKQKALKDKLMENAYLDTVGFRYQKYAQSVALITCEMVFYLIYRYSYSSTFLPGEFVPIGTFSVLAFLFYLLYSGEKGYSRKWVQYSFYFYYPFHLIVLGIFSMFFGVLANYL